MREGMKDTNTKELTESQKRPDWKKYLRDEGISDRERFDLVHLRAKQLEEKARIDE